ncbi:MAG: flagellin, partial [Fretibacterium sp.]|nr:flagellin [Fretibacterium sp.]
EISATNLKPGVDHTVTVGAVTAEALAPTKLAEKVKTATALDALFKVGVGAGNDGSNYEVAVTVKDRVYTADNAQASVTLEIKGFKLLANGTKTAVNETVTLTSKANGDAADDDTAVAAMATEFAIDKALSAAAKIKNMTVGDKAVYRMSNAMGTAGDGKRLDIVYDNDKGVLPSVTDPQTHQFNVADTVLTSNGTMTLSFLNLDEKTGEVTESSVTMKFNESNLVGVPLASDTHFTENLMLGNFKTYAIGDVARGDVKLRDLDKFWDAQGRFMISDPQTIKITQGDGKTASITLYANDTLDDVATKLNEAIGVGLGQNAYVDDVNHFSSFVSEAAAGNTSESVAGTFLIRSVVPGATGKLSLAGDEDLIKAFSLNVIQDSKESNYTVDIADAHTGKTIVSGAKTTGNKLIGVLHPNVDVEFDAMGGVAAKWDNTNKLYSFTPAKAYTTVLHLADNTTVFQIGANEGEDMGINIGDMRAHALGLNEVLVTDRESAARSITVIDNALDKVSTQRAKLGAYQNRLEHTINNLTVAGENLTAAESRIRDTDMAKEMMNFTKLNIMLQAGNAMLAQANQLPQHVLRLIR